MESNERHLLCTAKIFLLYPLLWIIHCNAILLFQVNSNNTTCSTHDEVVHFIKDSDSSFLTLKLIRPSKLPPGIQESKSFHGSPVPEMESEKLTHSPVFHRLSKDSEWDSSEDDQAVEMAGASGHPIDEQLDPGHSPSSQDAAVSQHSERSQSRSAQHPKTASIQGPSCVQNVLRTSASPLHSTTSISPLFVSDKMPRFQDARASEYDHVAQKLQSRKISQPSLPKPLTLDDSSDDEDSRLSPFAKALRRASLQRKARMKQNKPRITKPNSLLTSSLASNSNQTVPTKELESSSTDQAGSLLSQHTEMMDVNCIQEPPSPLDQTNMVPPPLQELASTEQDSISVEKRMEDEKEPSGELTAEDETEGEIGDGEANRCAQQRLHCLQVEST